jgi:CRP-like cAMP-binding protein
MTDDRTLADLRTSAFASDLAEDELRALAGIVERRSLVDGETLVVEGRADDRLHVVAEGKLAVVRQAEIGGRTTVAMLGPGDLAGELAFIDGSERHSSLVAVGAASVLSLSRATLERELDERPRLVWHVLCAIIRRAHQTHRRLSLQALELSNYVFKQHGRY